MIVVSSIYARNVPGNVRIKYLAPCIAEFSYISNNEKIFQTFDSKKI